MEPVVGSQYACAPDSAKPASQYMPHDAPNATVPPSSAQVRPRWPLFGACTSQLHAQVDAARGGGGG